MSLLGVLGKGLTLASNFIPGGSVVRQGVQLVGSQLLNGGDAQRAATKQQLLASLTQTPKPSIFPAGLPTPDSVVVTGSGTTIGGGSIFATGEAKATAYFPGSGLGPADPFGGVVSGASSTAPVVCAAGTGMRLNKTGYFLKSGQYIPPRSRCVKSRRRNPLNPRALSRAMSRLASAKKAAKALDRFEVKGRRCR